MQGGAPIKKKKVIDEITEELDLKEGLLTKQKTGCK